MRSQLPNLNNQCRRNQYPDLLAHRLAENPKAKPPFQPEAGHYMGSPLQFLSLYKTTEPKNAAQSIGEAEFYCLERMRSANDVPVSIEQNYYPEEVGQRFLGCNLNNVATCAKLEESGVTLWGTKQAIAARFPTKAEQELLEIEPSLPISFIERINHASFDRVVEYEQSVCRADYYAFVVKFERPSE